MITLPAALLSAMIAVESSGNDLAIGDGGRAWGALQITQAVLDDVNCIQTVIHFTRSACFDRGTSVVIAEVYLGHYCADDASWEILARTWNGGPHGARKPETLAYQHKIMAEVIRQRATNHLQAVGGNQPSSGSGNGVLRHSEPSLSAAPADCLSILSAGESPAFQLKATAQPANSEIGPQTRPAELIYFPK